MSKISSNQTHQDLELVHNFKMKIHQKIELIQNILIIMKKYIVI